MALLFRAMKESAGGGPEIGERGRALGIRPGFDIPVTDPADMIGPGQGGMSVSPDDPLNLPYIRRPPAYQGVGKDPAWEIDEAELNPDLAYRPDPANPDHGFVEPSRPMTAKEFQEALARTQGLWRKV